MPRYRVTRSTNRLETWDVEAASEEAALDVASGSGALAGESSISSVVPLDAPSSVWLPSGFGVYCRRLLSGGEEGLVERLQQAGVCWAALMVEASDGYISPLARSQRYAEALLAAGIRVAVWTLPGVQRATFSGSVAAAEVTLEHARACKASSVIFNIESAYKREAEALQALFSTVSRGMPAGASLGVVSYPVPSWHATLDSGKFAQADWGSPMLYETAGDVATIERAYREWGSLVGVIVPSLSAMGSGVSGAEQLESDIRRVLGDSPPAKSNAAMVWSEQQMTHLDRQVLRSSSERYGWCAAQ